MAGSSGPGRAAADLERLRRSMAARRRHRGLRVSREGIAPPTRALGLCSLVEYVSNGERCDKTVLRDSPLLRVEAKTPAITPVASPLVLPRLPGPPAPGPGAGPRPCSIRAPQPVFQPQPGMVQMPGLRLSDLQMGELLGAGGFGAVHRGWLRGFPKEVAIKKLHLVAGGAVTQENLAEFHKEAANLQALRHERLIQLIGIAVQPPFLCIVTELAPGGSLHDLLHVKHAILAEAQKKKVILQMTEGVVFLHGRRPPFVHRDLKSANVVLDLELNVKLCDLGITECMERTHISRREAEAGSPRYMAPELFDGRGKLTEKLDIWALGCLAVEVLTSRNPHEECINIQQVATKLLVRMQLPFQEDWANAYHPEVGQMLGPCFAWNPPDRPSAAQIYEVWSRLPKLTP
ncbi:unnamed protein product [Effrenium voratum]|uniref:Protein kinase domain-containing protein n=1 Tax=Effrenium voratum TaxID=2562239 RepID=A0AA36HVP7_9DINO|nr:unnamed protein product [Effrenium voratum]